MKHNSQLTKQDRIKDYNDRKYKELQHNKKHHKRYYDENDYDEEDLESYKEYFENNGDEEQ